jgi:hypothetical protein
MPSRSTGGAPLEHQSSSGSHPRWRRSSSSTSTSAPTLEAPPAVRRRQRENREIAAVVGLPAAPAALWDGHVAGAADMFGARSCAGWKSGEFGVDWRGRRRAGAGWRCAVLPVTERRGQREESVEDEEIRLVACMWAPHGTGVTCRSRRTGSRGSPG